MRFYPGAGARNEAYKGHAYAQPPKGFYQPLGYLYFKADAAVFTDTIMVVFFYDDKNSRKDNG
jgi:hypothetical protein